MTLPEPLKQAIEKEAQHFGLNTLMEGMQELTEKYRDPKAQQKLLMSSKRHRQAYIVYRMPATYAVNARIFDEINQRMPQTQFSSFLDLGSGPGTAFWAASEIFPFIQTKTLIEQDSDLIELSQRLAHAGQLKAIWKQQNILHDLKLNQHDLVVLSYVINELPEEEMLKVIQKAWQLTAHVLVVIEPGTPRGFSHIRLIREHLIQQGGHLVAPCPHSNRCPMAEGNWCHFSQRLERTRLHRQIKGGTLGYEDEKYSYLVVSRNPVPLPEARILRHPQRHSGHLKLELCSREGLLEQTLSKKEGERYKQAKKLEWGDTL